MGDTDSHCHNADEAPQSDASDQESHHDSCPSPHAPLLAIVSLPDSDLSDSTATATIRLRGDAEPDSLSGEIEYPPQLG